MHAAKLVKQLKSLDAEAEFRGWGGDRMEEEGVALAKHIRETSFMGFLEVAMNLRTISSFIKYCKSDIKDWNPDVVILVDYAGFNLKIAEFTKAQGFKTYYYISPKVWAWNTKRAYKIKRLVDKMFVIMHFEQAFYKKYDFEVDYVGNPLFDAVAEFTPNANFLEENKLADTKPIVALLPGSRKQEVKSILGKMVEIASKFPNYQFVVAGVSELPDELYEPAKALNLPIILNQTYDLLTHSKAALVTSGTATLETALLKVPQVVCYKTGTVSYLIAKNLIQVPYISLVNLIADKPLVKELIQSDLNAENLKEELGKVLGEGRETMLKGYEEMIEKIQTEGASKRAAKLMYGYLTE